MSSLSSFNPDKLSSFRIEQSEAGAFIQASKGREMSRLKFGADSRFYISAFSSSRTTYLRGKIGTVRGRLIQINDNDRTIFVSVRSACRRLRLEESEVRRLARNGKFNLSYIQERIAKLNEAMPGYDRIVEAVQTKAKGELPIGALQEIFSEVSKAMNSESSSKRSIKSVYFPIQLKNVKNMRDGTYYCNIDKTKEAVEVIFLRKELGEGSCGKAWQISHVKEGEKTEVAKCVIGKQTSMEVATKMKEIDNEREKLDDLNVKGARWGIQAGPRKVIDMTASKPEASGYGYLGMQYNGDYADMLADPASLNDLLFEFHQLLLGLKQIADVGILHGDIKPQNIFVKEDQDKTRLLHLSDFGGARLANRTELRIREGYTPPYSSQEDISYWKTSTDETEKIIQSEKARDVFSIGQVFYGRLTNRGAYPMTQEGWPILYRGEEIAYDPITRTDIPTEVSTLIQEMMHPDYTKRPTADEAFRRFDNFLKVNYSDLYKTIWTKIEKEYPGTTQGSLTDHISGEQTIAQKDGVVRKGEFRYGLLNGQGEKRVKGGVWKGNFRNNVLDGRGEIILANGNTCKGIFREGWLTGPTKLKVGDTTWEFHAVDGKIKGPVTITLPGKGVWKGKFKESESVEEVLRGLKRFSLADIDGAGELTDLEGKKLVGMFIKGRLNGLGKIIFPAEFVCKGKFENNRLQGKGTISMGNHKVAVTFKDNHVTQLTYFRLSRKGDGVGGIFYPYGRIEWGTFKGSKVDKSKTLNVYSL